MPRQHLLEAWPDEGRLRNCAIAAAVERAVGARYQHLRRWVDVDGTEEGGLSDRGSGFAAQLQSVIAAILEQRKIEALDHNRWRAGRQRWSDVLRDLSTSDPIDAHARHPNTHDWQRRGLLLDGSTVEEQLTYLTLHPSYALDADKVLLGDVYASGFQEAVRALTGEVTREYLKRALEYVIDKPNAKILLEYLGEDFEKARG